MEIKKCAYFGKCGGCQLQPPTQEEYLKQKEEFLSEILTNIPYKKLNPIITFPTGIRRKATFKIDYGCNIGFFKEKSNDIIPILKCRQFTNEINSLLIPLKKLCKNFVKRSEGNITITQTDTGLTIHFNNISLMQTDTHKIKAFAEQYNIQRITSGNSEIFKSQEPMIFFNNIKVPYPPKTFLQPSKQSEEKIIETVLNMLSQKHYNKIADIFSGLGLFSFYLKDYCDEIFATDCDELAIKQLLKIAHSYHFNINAKTNDLFKHPIKSEKLNDFDLIVIDPPRDGAKSQTTEIAKSNVNEIIYISCNPIAFKTDAKILIDAGYTLQEITPIDQFTNTKHIELIAKFQKD